MCGAETCSQLSEEIPSPYNRPFPFHRLMLRRTPRNFPFGAGVVLINSDNVGNLKVAVDCAIEASCITSTVKLLRWGFADWAKEGHGQRSVLIHFLVNGSGAPSLNLALTNSANRTVINSAIASTPQLGKGVNCLRDRSPRTHSPFLRGFCSLSLAADALALLLAQSRLRDGGRKHDGDHRCPKPVLARWR